MLNAIFYVLVQGCKWRDLPGDFPAWQTVYTYFRNWRIDGTWIEIHARLRLWTRVDHERLPSPSEAIVDSQSVETATPDPSSCRLRCCQKDQGTQTASDCRYIRLSIARTGYCCQYTGARRRQTSFSQSSADGRYGVSSEHGLG